MKLEFIDELTEARLFKHQRDFHRYNNRDLAELSMLIILICTAYQQDNFVKHYLDETIAMGDFSRIRSSSTDFANIVAVMKEYDQYKIKITNSNISFPEMQFKQFVREITGSGLSSKDAHRYLFAFEDFLKIGSSAFKKMRRTALNWAEASPSDRQEFRKFAIQLFSQTAMGLDFFQWYKNVS